MLGIDRDKMDSKVKLKLDIYILIRRNTPCGCELARLIFQEFLCEIGVFHTRNNFSYFWPIDVFLKKMSVKINFSPFSCVLSEFWTGK